MSQQMEATGQMAQSYASSNKDITRLAAGASITLVGKVTGQALQFSSQVVLARLLGAEAFGLYAIGSTILRMVGMLAPLGLDNGAIRFGARYWREDDASLGSVLLRSLGLALISGLLLSSGIFFFAASWLANQVFQKPDLAWVIRGFALALPFLTGLRVASATTLISQRAKFAVYAEEITPAGVNLILVLLFLLLGWQLFGAVAAIVCSSGIAFLLALSYVRRLFPYTFSAWRKSGVSTRELLTFSLPTALTRLFSVFIIRMDRLFVGHFYPAAAVGVYQAATQSSVVFAFILAALNTIFSPMIASLYQEGEMKRLEELFRVSTKWGIYFSIPVFLVICFAPYETMTVVFGSEYSVGALPLVILTVGTLVNVGTGPVGRMLVMTGHQKRWLIISSVVVMMNVALSLLLIPRLGLMGAALASASATSGLYLTGLFTVRRLLGLWPYDRRYLKGLWATILAAAALLALRFAAVGSPALTLLLTVAVSSGAFGGTLLLLGLDAEDQEFIRLIHARLG
jgi:O-antigen/teichoic acid export membrane protein